MSQYVIEFGAERVHTIAKAISLCLPSQIKISVEEEAHPLHYVETRRTLTEVVTDLETGIVASAVIRCTDEQIRYALISSPLVNKEGLSKWMGTIELGVETWSFVWDALLTSPDLLFVCVGHEEGVELRDEQLTVDSFQWSKWPLLIGAVRPTQGNEWVIRRRAASV